MNRSNLQTGDLVRMSESYKIALLGSCNHKPTDRASVEECVRCSTTHVEEFGECTGVVLGLTNYNNHFEEFDDSKVGPEVDVRWQTSNLRYAYHPDNLVKIP